MRYILSLLIVIIHQTSFAQVKVLFDATKAETAGQADWIIDADLFNLNWNPNAYTGTNNWHSNAQKIPTPAQSGITASTNENYWTGGISAWAVDCAKKGYTVETLPWNGQITYGNSSNTQDLTNYKIFIVCEPNIPFTASEKTAMMQFVQNGGGLFIVADHDNSDRNGDGFDSPAIWNDFFNNNSVQSNPFGISFDLLDFSGTYSNMASLPTTDSILHGSMGNVTQVKWASGTSMTLNTTANPTVKAVCYKTGTSGNSNVLFAYARFGNGKICAIGDSSPCDDGTGNPSGNITLYNGYFTDAAGNHQRLLMNATIWLATSNATTPNAVITPSGNTTFCQGGSVLLSSNTGTGYTYQWKNNNTNITGATNSTYIATQSGSYTVTINNSATSNPIQVTVNPLPVPGVINTNNVLTATGGTFAAYSWYYNNTIIPSATNQTFTATQNGTYKVKVTDINACSAFSQDLNVTLVGIDFFTKKQLKIYPNPTSDVIKIEGVDFEKIKIYNLLGELIKEEISAPSISTEGLSTGIYVLTLFDKNGNKIAVELIEKMK